MKRIILPVLSLVVLGLVLFLFFRPKPGPDHGSDRGPPLLPELSPTEVIKGDGGQGASLLAVTSDGRYLAFVTLPGRVIRLWDVEAGRELSAVQGPEGMGRLAFLPGGRTLAVLTAGGKTVELVNTESGRKERTVELPQAALAALAASTAGFPGLAPGPGPLLAATALFPGRTSEDSPLCLAISPDARLVATGHLKAVHVLSLETGKLVRTLTFEDVTAPIEINTLAFTPDGKTLVTGGSRFQDQPGPVRFWEVGTWKNVGSLPRGAYSYERADTLAVSPQGDLIAYTTPMEMLVADRHDNREVLKDSRPTSNLAFSPDGRWIAWGDIDMMTDLGRRIQADVDALDNQGQTPAVQGPRVSTVRLFLFDVKAGTPRMIFRKQYPRVWQVAFCGDGSKLATAHDDNSVQVWDLAGLTGP